jgi:hypothetical protein
MRDVVSGRLKNPRYDQLSRFGTRMNGNIQEMEGVGVVQPCALQGTRMSPRAHQTLSQGEMRARRRGNARRSRCLH